MLDRTESAIPYFGPVRWCAMGVVVIAIAHGGVPRAMAQAPASRTRPAAAEKSPWKEIRSAEPPSASAALAKKMLVDGDITDQKTFDEYWSFVVSQLTWQQNIDDYARIRTEIRKYLQRSKPGQAHDRLAKEIILPFCEKVAKSKEFSPQTRFNVLMTIGELCQVEMNNAGSGAKSLPEARPVLLQFLDPKNPIDGTSDALRFAAMEGITRHLERGGISDDAQRKQIESAMQSFINAQQAPAGRDASVHKWMQAKANRILAGVNGGAVVRGG